MQSQFLIFGPTFSGRKLTFGPQHTRSWCSSGSAQTVSLCLPVLPVTQGGDHRLAPQCQLRWGSIPNPALWLQPIRGLVAELFAAFGQVPTPPPHPRDDVHVPRTSRLFRERTHLLPSSAQRRDRGVRSYNGLLRRIWTALSLNPISPVCSLCMVTSPGYVWEGKPKNPFVLFINSINADISSTPAKSSTPKHPKVLVDWETPHLFHFLHFTIFKVQKGL